jgi:sulfite exporter TauE/SafE
MNQAVGRVVTYAVVGAFIGLIIAGPAGAAIGAKKGACIGCAGG